MIDQKLTKVVGRREKDEFRLGVDWLLPEDGGRPCLLELNLSPPREGDDSDYSRVRHFFEIGTDKLHQHQLFGDLMPDFTSDGTQFADFCEERVYKKRTGSMGNGVSVLEEPEWEADFVEEFVRPRAQVVEGKHFPFVIRDYLNVEVGGRAIGWEQDSTFRKQSKVAVEDAASQNDVYKLNTMSGVAEIEDLLPEEMEMVREATPEMMNRVVRKAVEAGWDPTKVFDSALVGFYIGYRRAMFGGYPDSFVKIDEILKGRGIELSPYSVMGGLKRAMKSAEYGADLMVLTNGHSIKWDGMMRTRYRIERGEDDVILHKTQHDERVFEKFPPRGNVCIENGQSPRELADLVEENYHMNRPIF